MTRPLKKSHVARKLHEVYGLPEDQARAVELELWESMNWRKKVWFKAKEFAYSRPAVTGFGIGVLAVSAWAFGFVVAAFAAGVAAWVLREIDDRHAR
jgi:hypothetical protein